jgi:hypothetical protein
VAGLRRDVKGARRMRGAEEEAGGAELGSQPLLAAVINFSSVIVAKGRQIEGEQCLTRGGVPTPELS